MNTFIVTVKHDKGTARIRTAAQDEAAARKIIMSAEGCPDRAIIKVKEIKRETMKKVIAYILKEENINQLIAFKKMYADKSEGTGLLYWSIKNMLGYNWTKEEILHQFNWQLRMYKDHAQYSSY